MAIAAALISSAIGIWTSSKVAVARGKLGLLEDDAPGVNELDSNFKKISVGVFLSNCLCTGAALCFFFGLAALVVFAVPALR